jgi:4-hydroxybenzoate polyprenyltransferase
VIAYFVERFSPVIFVPAAVGIAVAARVSSSASDPSSLNGLGGLVDVVIALLLIAQFRLWDDLADRELDRLTHPDRILVRAERIGPYVTVCVALAIVNLVASAWRGGWLGVGVLAALDGSFVAWYAGRSSQRTVIGALWGLAKYSVFVIVMAARSSIFSHLLPAASVIYVVACAYETLHDASSPLARFTRVAVLRWRRQKPPACAQQRLRPERGAKAPSESAWGWSPTRIEKRGPSA